jgi:hypothetical protein
VNGDHRRRQYSPQVAIAVSLAAFNGGGPLAAPVGGAQHASIALTASLA